MPTKTTTKKVTVKKNVPVKSTPVRESKCACGGKCNCHYHGAAHLIKHIIVWAIIFALGMVCGKMMCGCHHGMKHTPKMNPVFENGCLKVDSVGCPMMREKLMAADMDGNECISLEEYKAVKKGMREHNGPRGPRMGR